MQTNTFQTTCCLLALLFLSACAANVTQIPTNFSSIHAGESTEAITLSQQTTVRPATGYARKLPAGSRWRRIGKISQGDVYKPIGSVFTLAGAHVHEAYLVLDGKRLAGFYLPVEGSFSPLIEQAPISFSSSTSQ